MTMEHVNMLPDHSGREASVSPSHSSQFPSKSDLALLLERLDRTPSDLTDGQVRKTTLSTLTRSLGQQLSSRVVIDTYLRWLDIQRQAPSNNHSPTWQLVLTSWIKALKKRGFSLSEVTREVSKWKAANSPLKISSTTRESRSLPSSSQLELSWKGISRECASSLPYSKLEPKAYTELSNKMYDTPPIVAPSYYVCHRCNGKGHYVEDCPTNADPTYDLAPGNDYQCRHCKQRGDHYCLFCPKNPNPNSVYKKRQATTQSEISAYGNMRGYFPHPSETSWCASRPSPSPYDHSSPGRNAENALVIKRKLSSSWITPNNLGTAIEDPFTEHPGKIGPTKGNQSGITEFDYTGLPIKEASYALKRCRIERNISLSPQPSSGFNSNGKALQKRVQALQENPLTSLQDTDSNGRNWERDRSQNDIRREASKVEWKQAQLTPLAVNHVPSSPTVESKQKVFLAKLFSSFPSEVRNLQKLRPTAMDMWEISDARKLQNELTESNQKMTGYFTPNESLGEHRRSEEVDRPFELFRQSWRDDEDRVDTTSNTHAETAIVDIWEVSGGRTFREEAGEFTEETKITTPDISPRELKDAIEDLIADPRMHWNNDDAPKKHPDIELERAPLLSDTMIQRGQIWVQHLELKLLDYQQSRLMEISRHELGISSLSRNCLAEHEVQAAIQKIKNEADQATKQLENVEILRGMLEMGEEVDGALMERMMSRPIAQQYVQYISEGC